jgi:hypothetical protein
MPSSLIEQENRTGSWCDFGGDLDEMQAHGFDVARR